MKKRNLFTITLFTIICALITTFGYYLYHITNPVYKMQPPLSDGRYFIAHATGSLEGYTYLNSKESLIESLDNGYKNIEIDLQYTSDSVLVCVHDWEQFNKASIPNLHGKDSDKIQRIPSLEEFKMRKIYGKYTPISLDDVIQIHNTRDFTIVTDLICDAVSLNKYFKKSQRKNVMVEAFSEKEYKALKESGYKPMLSIGCIKYLDCINFIISHIFDRNYEWVTVEAKSSKRSLRLLKKIYGFKIALYTTNSPSFFTWYLGNDFDMIFTDNWNLKTQINNYQDNGTH